MHTASLARLQLDYVDVVFAHMPDPDTPMEETVRAMNWVLSQGWAFYWGTSNWNAAAIDEAWQVANRLGLIGPAAEQPQYNMFKREQVEEEYAPLYEKYGTGLTTFSPLACGLLSGKYSGGRCRRAAGSRSIATRCVCNWLSNFDDMPLLHVTRTACTVDGCHLTC